MWATFFPPPFLPLPPSLLIIFSKLGITLRIIWKSPQNNYCWCHAKSSLHKYATNICLYIWNSRKIPKLPDSFFGALIICLCFVYFISTLYFWRPVYPVIFSGNKEVSDLLRVSFSVSDSCGGEGRVDVLQLFTSGAKPYKFLKTPGKKSKRPENSRKFSKLPKPLFPDFCIFVHIG